MFVEYEQGRDRRDFVVVHHHRAWRRWCGGLRRQCVGCDDGVVPTDCSIGLRWRIYIFLSICLAASETQWNSENKLRVILC